VQTTTVQVFVINEATLFPFLWSVISGRKPVVLAIEPWFPPFTQMIDKLVSRLIASGRSCEIISLCPDETQLWNYPLRTLLYNVFGRTEVWHNCYFHYDEATDSSADYGFSYKHLTCNFMKIRHFQVLLLGRALDADTAEKIVVHGLPPETVGLMNAYWQNRFFSRLKPMEAPRRIVNALIAIGILMASTIWILFRLRVFAPSPRLVFAMADCIGDSRDLQLYRAFQEGGDVVLVARNKAIGPGHAEIESGFECVERGQGIVPFLEWPGYMAMLVRDLIHLLQTFGDRVPAHFYKVAVLPFYRARYRALFRRFQPQFFWGRDDYNEDHLIRRQELQQFGGLSLGVIHGWPSYANLFPMWRYISFDTYFVFGRALHERYTHDTWAKDMAVIPAGSFGASREAYQLVTFKRPKDIVIMASVFIGEPLMVSFIRDLAQAFPERKVFLQIKSTFINKSEGRIFVARCQRELSNVILCSDPLYAMFTKGRYAFSDPSTAVVEALQFGQMAFCIDVLKHHDTCIYREFPGLCVTSGAEAVERIIKIESGEWAYDRNEYSDLVDLSGRPFIDYVREAVGLPTLTTITHNAPLNHKREATLP
jgi:hypothetical protein